MRTLLQEFIKVSAALIKPDLNSFPLNKCGDVYAQTCVESNHPQLKRFPFNFINTIHTVRF